MTFLRHSLQIVIMKAA